MKLEMGIGLRQHIEIGQKIELRQQINLKNFEAIERGVVGDPDDLLADVIAYTVAHMPNESVRSTIRDVLAEPSLRAALLANATEVAFDPRQHTIERFAARWFHDTHAATITVETKINHDNVEIPIPLEAYLNALFNPMAVERELAQLKSFTVDPRRKPDEGTLMRLAELQGALDLVPTIRTYIEPVAQAVQYSLMTRADGQQPLLNFLRDLSVIQNTRFVLSTRMIERFSSRFVRIGKRSRPQEFENAFLNCIGEYVLVGFGVIEPDLFRLYRAEIVERIHSGGAPSNASERAVAEAQNPKKQLFFQRWGVIGKPATPQTDAAIRDFVTITIREQKERLLSSLQFADLFEQMKTALFGEDDRRVSDDDARDGVRDEWDTFFSKPEIESELIVLARTVWLPVKKI